MGRILSFGCGSEGRKAEGDCSRRSPTRAPVTAWIKSILGFGWQIFLVWPPFYICIKTCMAIATLRFLTPSGKAAPKPFPRKSQKGQQPERFQLWHWHEFGLSFFIKIISWTSKVNTRKKRHDKIQQLQNSCRSRGMGWKELIFHQARYLGPYKSKRGVGRNFSHVKISPQLLFYTFLWLAL